MNWICPGNSFEDHLTIGIVWAIGSSVVYELGSSKQLIAETGNQLELSSKLIPVLAQFFVFVQAIDFGCSPLIVQAIDFGCSPLNCPDNDFVSYLLIGFVWTIDFGCCLLNGIVQTINFGCCELHGIVQTDFGDWKVVGIVRTIHFKCRARNQLLDKCHGRTYLLYYDRHSPLNWNYS